MSPSPPGHRHQVPLQSSSSSSSGGGGGKAPPDAQVYIVVPDTSESTEGSGQQRAPQPQLQLQDDCNNNNTLAPRPVLATKDPNSSARGSDRRLLRKKSSGLLSRLKSLDPRNRRSVVIVEPVADQAPPSPPAPERIPDEQPRELEGQQYPQAPEREIEVKRRGRGWSAPTVSPTLDPALPPTPPPQLDLCLPAGTVSFSSAMSAFVHESDASSIMSVSDRLMPSDSEVEDLLADKQKYRLPEIGKSRGSSRNGFVLEDGTIASRGERAPTPPPKDPPSYRNSDANYDADDSRSINAEQSDFESYFNPSNLSRAGSVYTLSRASFANQLSQLTSIKLPQASSLSSSISSIPTSTGAARALNDASDQIRLWIKKASEVLNGLDAEDDVEWAAAGGREGLGDVDTAVNRFETLIDVYVSAIEQLESRNDIDSLTAEELQGVVTRMDKILKHWNKIKATLQGIKEQVEVAMEWEELWNTVLGEIGQETEGISRIIFEMEERRHRGLLDAMAEPGHQLDIQELETIVEEAPSRTASAVAAARGLTAEIKASSESEDQTPAPPASEEDKNLVGLYARMQPLRASLDFLPMRLSAFMMRAKDIFPTGCDELRRRREYLEDKYKKLEADAESLRRELGEDRWVIIFRKASRQALKMSESVERSVAKLQEALDEGAQHTNPAALAKKIENYDAKKEHYGPAIQQVLAIIDKGVQTRLTVNGEILRLQADMKKKWDELEGHTKAMDFALDQLQINKAQSLRDSVSTILSSQHSVASSSGAVTDTPGSSPASSVVFLGRRDSGPSTPYASSRKEIMSSGTTARSQVGKRYSSMPTSMSSSQSNIPRKTPLSRSSVSELRPSAGVSSRLYSSPPPRSVSRTESRTDNRPRWNGSTNLSDTLIGHNFKPLTATTPSPYRKAIPPRTPRSTSAAQPSPLARSSINSRPPSAMHSSNRAPSSASQPLPKLRTTASSPAVPQSGKAPLSSARKFTPSSAQPKPESHLSKPSVYIPSGPTTPGSTSVFGGYTPSTASSASTATLTSHSRETSTTDTAGGAEKVTTTASSTLANPGEESPSSRLSKGRPGTSLAGRRSSMLPQPKRTGTPSGVRGGAMSPGGDAGTPSARRMSSFGGRMSSLGGRMSSLGFNRPGSKDGSGKK